MALASVTLTARFVVPPSRAAARAHRLAHARAV